MQSRAGRRSAIRVHQFRAGHAGLGGDRRVGQWNGAAGRLRLADARGRTRATASCARTCCRAARSRAAVYSLAGRIVRFGLQMEGRHRSGRLAQVQPEHDLGRVLGLLRLRHGRIPGALPAARRRADDRAGSDQHRPRAARVRARLGPLPGRSADYRMGSAARRERPSRALSRAVLPDRQRADEPRASRRRSTPPSSTCTAAGCAPSPPSRESSPAAKSAPTT